MKTDYIKYREFLRDFALFKENADPDTIYEVVGNGGTTVGYFSLSNPLKHDHDIRTD